MPEPIAERKERIGEGFMASRIHFLSNSGECLRHTLVDRIERGQGVGDAHKGKYKSEVLPFKCIPKDVLVQAIRLPHQPLHAVTIHSMMKTLLGHRHQD